MIYIIFLFISPLSAFNYSLPSLLFSKIQDIKSENPADLVKTQNGILEGTILQCANNRSVLGFLGKRHSIVEK